MEFVQHTIAWCKGELLEATLIGVSGVVMILVGLAFWRFGVTPGAKAMLIPLLVLGILLAAAGGSGVVINQQRIPRFEQAFRADPAAFVQAEQARVEGFQGLYVITLVLAPVCFAVAVGCFWGSLNPHLRAVAIALVLFGLAGLVVDHFSKERADAYYREIRAERSASH